MKAWTAAPALGALAFVAGLREFGAREPWLALAAVPAILWLPGIPLAKALAARRGDTGDGVRLAFDAWWVGVAQAVFVAAAGKLGGATLALLAAGGLTLFGMLVQTVVPRAPASNGPVVPRPTLVFERIAACFLVGCVALWFYVERVTVARPLAAYWWSAQVEDLPETCGPLLVVGATPLDDEGQVVRLPVRPERAVELPSGGPLLVLLRGAVGQKASVGGASFAIEGSPVEDESEGPVRRYAPGGGGIAARWIPDGSDARALTVDSPATAYVIGAQDGVWALDGSGEAHLAHYYQILNMVEQFDWVRDRWITDVQPPLWSWVLGSVVGVTAGGMPTANVLLAFVLVAGGLGGILFLRRFAPDAPIVAWLLPGACAAVIGKLVIEPGSAPMPDALYTAAIVGALATAGEGWKTSSFLGLGAQLLRYPGSAVVGLGLVLGGMPRVAVRFGAIILAAILVFGAGGWATGALDGWLQTVAWESGPEHWHGNYATADLLARIPTFYGTLVYYAGGAPLLALVALPRGTRIALGTAAIYSLLLCTIDHSPTHYFLPLVNLSVLAVGSSSAAVERRWLAVGSSALAVSGLLLFWFTGDILG